MKNIYKGPVRKLIVSKLEVKNGIAMLADYETPIVKKDLLFYKGLFNEYVSFDFNTILPDKEEAISHIKAIIELFEITEKPFPNCDFVNSSEIEYSHQVSKEEFKALKKEYRKQRKMMKQKRK